MARQENIPQDDINCRLTGDWKTKIYPSETDVYNVHDPIRVFLAGPWFWPEAEACMRGAFKILDEDPRFEVWCAMVHGKLDMKEYYRLRAQYETDGPPGEEFTRAVMLADFEREWDKKKQEAFQRDMLHILWCDFLVGMIENWDSGTMFEMGGVRTLEKPCIAFSYETNRECNLMLERAIVGFTTAGFDLIPMIEEKILSKARHVSTAPEISLTIPRYLGEG